MGVDGPRRALFPAALLVAALLPFAAIPPLVTTPWFALTDDKLVLLTLIAAWALLGKRAIPSPAEWRTLLPSLVFVLVTLVSARLAAAEYADEALRYALRLLAAAFVMLVVLRLGETPGRTNSLLWAIVIGGGASALLGVGESLQWAFAQPVLSLFKVAPTRVGGELRVGASFQYATIASMYFEMVAPLAITLAATARGRTAQFLGIAIAVVCTANVVLSLTRAGMLTLGVVYAMLLFAAFRIDVRRILVPTLLSAGVLLGGVGLLFWHDQVFDLRLITESDADWYGAKYTAPAALTLQANQTAKIDLDVRNEGRITWTTSGDHPFALGYRWLTNDGDGVLDLPPAEVPLPRDIPPGDNIHLLATVNVPDLPSGSYRLDWGMLQRDVLQFYERGWTDAQTKVSVDTAAPGATMPAITERDDAEAPWVVGRLDLWSAAVKLFAAHPLLGVGPDNFRHYYGAEFGLEGWDERVQANNLYLEILADLGIVGLLAFLGVIVGPIRSIIRTLRTQDEAYIALGVAVSAGAFLLHGLLDSFLAFTPTALVLWMLLAISARAQKPQVSGR